MENSTTNPNSKKVWIRRSTSFISRAQEATAKDFFRDGTISVGSYFEKVTNKRVGSGMTMAEEAILVPAIIGIHPQDRDYFKERNAYFAAFETKIPPDDGLQLEIGLSDSNTKPLSDTNLPISVTDYIIYRHAKGHPWCAPSKDEARGNQLKQYYIYDPIIEAGNKNVSNNLKDTALEYYLKVKSNPDKVNMMLLLLDVDYRDIEGQNVEHTTQLRADKLRSFIDTKYDTIVKLYEDRDFEIKYNIEAMVRTGVLKRVGTRVVVSETGDVLGNTTEDAIYFFKDEETNSATISLLKEKMQEGLRNNKKVKQSKKVAS